MSEGGSASEVWKSIELGAAEYLEKPLSTLKLRNIWQHVVRKVVLFQQHHYGCWHAKHSTQLPIVQYSFCTYTSIFSIVCR